MTKSERALQFYYTRKAAGVCVRCGSPDTDGHTRCKKCRQKASAYEKERYLTLWQQGRCTRCKEPLDVIGYILCSKCKAYERRSKAKKKGAA